MTIASSLSWPRRKPRRAHSNRGWKSGHTYDRDSRATDRKALGAPKDHIEPVVDDVGFAALELPAQGQEPERGQVGVVLDPGLMIGGDLLDEELIVRKIDVECTHGPISERGSRGVGGFPVGAGAFRVGIAGHVQPVPGPALAKLAGREQAVDQNGVGPGAWSRSKASTSCSVGGSPVRSKVTLRIKVRRSAVGDGLSFRPPAARE